MKTTGMLFQAAPLLVRMHLRRLPLDSGNKPPGGVESVPQRFPPLGWLRTSFSSR